MIYSESSNAAVKKTAKSLTLLPATEVKDTIGIIKDAKENQSLTYTVEITQEQIDKGGYRAYDCPVFRAMQEAGIKVGGVMTDSFILRDRIGERFSFPLAVFEWISNYDRFDLPFSNTEEPKPFEFVLDIVSEEQPV